MLQVRVTGIDDATMRLARTWIVRSLPTGCRLMRRPRWYLTPRVAQHRKDHPFELVLHQVRRGGVRKR